MINHLDHFEDNDYFHYLDNISTTLESIEAYNTYVVHEIVHLYHVYDIRKNIVAMQNLIAHLTKEQMKKLLEIATKFELYEFCSVIHNVIKVHEENCNN